MQEIEERVQKREETQLEVSQLKENEKVEEDVLEPEEGILVIFEDAKQEKEEKIGGNDREVNWQRDAEEELAHPPSEKYSSEIQKVVKTKEAQDEEKRGRR